MIFKEIFQFQKFDEVTMKNLLKLPKLQAFCHLLAKLVWNFNFSFSQTSALKLLATWILLNTSMKQLLKQDAA